MNQIIGKGNVQKASKKHAGKGGITDEEWQAIKLNDESYNGMFFYGVKSTYSAAPHANRGFHRRQM